MKITCGIFLYNTRLNKILICHATNSPWNKWSIPKGIRDKGESSYKAAARELFEETGISLEKLHILGLHTLPPVLYKKQRKTLEAFLVLTDDDDLEHFPFQCITHTGKSHPEIDVWKWVTLEMTGGLHDSQKENLSLVRKLTGQETIVNQE